MLFYYDYTRLVHLEVDTSIEGHGAILYYVKYDPAPIVENNKAKNFLRKDIEVIMYLSKALNDTKTRY